MRNHPLQQLLNLIVDVLLTLLLGELSHFMQQLLDRALRLLTQLAAGLAEMGVRFIQLALHGMGKFLKPLLTQGLQLLLHLLHGVIQFRPALLHGVLLEWIRPFRRSAYRSGAVG